MKGYKPAHKRRVSLAGVRFVAGFEGFASCPYLDMVGVPTIGYGHTEGVSMNDSCISKATGLKLARRDLRACADAVRQNVKVQVTQHQFDALVSLVFNVGPGDVMDENNSTLLRLLNARDYKGAADQFQRWDMAGGRHVPGLTRRRKAEAAMFRKPPRGQK